MNSSVFFSLAHASGVLISLSVFVLISAVIWDFVEFHKRGGEKKERKSVVETGTMFLYFFLFYALIRFDIGRMDFFPLLIQMGAMVLGTFAVVAGCSVNVWGRFSLGKNWSNQVKIYRDHTFVNRGAYGIVRHPLYASLLWMFLGGSLAFLNWAAFLSAIGIFWPAMRYRAKQEEEFLKKEFPEYESYQKNTGMFFPKCFKK